MLVETYELEEINASEASTMAADSEAIGLIEQLGLEGQRQLCAPDTGTRFPYPRMSASQFAVFNELFPEHTKVAEYRQGIIPLRVLQVVAFCKELPQTKHIEVWHAETIKEDPLLVGAPASYASEYYLLARWGDALPSFDSLKAKAAIRAAASIKLELVKGQRQFEHLLANVKEIAQLYIDTGKKPTWWIHE